MTSSAAPRGQDSGRRLALALSVRGSLARQPGRLPALPRHALPRFSTQGVQISAWLSLTCSSLSEGRERRFLPRPRGRGICAANLMTTGHHPFVPPDDNHSGDRSPDAGRYDGAFCHRPASGEHRGVPGVVPPEENCITCGDIAVEVRVARLLPDALAVVDAGNGEEQVSVALVTVTVGDRILVHAGEAIAVVGR